MKTSILLAALCCLCSVSCDLWELSMPGTKTRDECRRKNPNKDKGFGDNGIIKLDTSIFFSAVVFPEEYDWLKDSSYGLAPFKLAFYENNEEILSIYSNSGLVSANPDTHHIIGGSLYTEYNKPGQTIICRNGEEILRINKDGTLKGLFEGEDGLYLLFQEKFTRSISLRKGQDVIFEAADADVFGDFSEPSYLPGGALYEDKGKICFCYSSSKDGLCYKVIDGKKESTVLAKGARNVLDMKLIDGQCRYAYNRYGTKILEEARIWRTFKGYQICGLLQESSTPKVSAATLIDENGTLIEKICLLPGLIYLSEKQRFVVYDSEEYGLQTFSSIEDSVYSHENRILMNPSCASIDGSGIHLALSARNRKESPYILSGKKRKECNIHGFISSLSAQISLPTIEVCCRLPGVPYEPQESPQEAALLCSLPIP